MRHTRNYRNRSKRKKIYLRNAAYVKMKDFFLYAKIILEIWHSLHGHNNMFQSEVGCFFLST